MSVAWQAEGFVASLRHTSPHTRAAYTADVTQFLRWAERGGCPDPSALDRRVLRRYLAYLDTRGFARASIARKAAALRAYVRYLRRHGLVTDDVGRSLRAPKSAGDVELARAPGAKTIRQLLGEFRGISSRPERFAREHRRRLMMLPAPSAGRRQCRHDIRTDRADQPDEVADDRLAAPLLERLVDAEGESKVDGAGEVLLRPIEPMDCRQLFGPEDAQRLEQFRSDLVLTSVPPRGRHEGGTEPQTAVQHHEERVVLIVGMRGRHHEDAGVGEVAEGEAQGDVSPFHVERDDTQLRDRPGERQNRGDESDQNGSHRWTSAWFTSKPRVYTAKLRARGQRRADVCRTSS